MTAEPCKHQWYVFDRDTNKLWWACAKKCGAEKTTATAERHLNNAIAACYANAGPSAALADIREAMRQLLMTENTLPWEHWNARGEREWQNP